jgi:hypothetical protein
MLEIDAKLRQIVTLEYIMLIGREGLPAVLRVPDLTT